MTMLLESEVLASRGAIRGSRAVSGDPDLHTCLTPSPHVGPDVALLTQLPVRSIPRRSVIFQQGAASTSMLYLRDGLVTVATKHPTGADSLYLVGPGDLLGEEMLSGLGRRSTATAVLPTTCHELSLPLLDNVLTHDPRLARALLAHVSVQVGSALQLSAFLAGTPPMARVGHCVASLTSQLGIVVAEGVLVEHGLTQRELSLVAGCSRETINRTLHAFAAQGWLRMQTRSFLVTDRDELLGFEVQQSSSVLKEMVEVGEVRDLDGVRGQPGEVHRTPVGD